MIRLPDGFEPLFIAGYFIEVSTKTVWSIKSGILKPIKKSRSWNRAFCFGWEGFAISHLGQRRFITMDRIEEIIKYHDPKAVHVIQTETK